MVEIMDANLLSPLQFRRPVATKVSDPGYAKLTPKKLPSPVSRGEQRISVLMALEALRDQVAITRAAEDDFRAAMSERNDMIREARHAGIRSGVIERITGLSRDRIARIAARPCD